MVFTVNEEKRIICLFAIYELPLDFWLWGHLGKIVHGANPRSIDELMQTVEDARNTITPDNIEESLRNLTKRLQSCVAQNGGHFQHLL